MKMQTLAITTFAGILFTLQTHAETMECDEAIIEDGEAGSMMAEVIEKCGEPTSRDGDSYVYVKEDTTYVLVFDDAGKLSSISISVDEEE